MNNIGFWEEERSFDGISDSLGGGGGGGVVVCVPQGDLVSIFFSLLYVFCADRGIGRLGFDRDEKVYGMEEVQVVGMVDCKCVWGVWLIVV